MISNRWLRGRQACGGRRKVSPICGMAAPAPAPGSAGWREGDGSLEVEERTRNNTVNATLSKLRTDRQNATHAGKAVIGVDDSKAHEYTTCFHNEDDQRERERDMRSSERRDASP